ncbi:IclR family transcriptional regulator [Streptomyces pseudovenezuelae]|uniref:IclR family transcriptional regulator n=1 Tax=Streptomyces pseudovenezuelae TaxID=67350 RepID=UPI002E822B37|nr:IclR family transcriptional regulator [Streptomyces pseudovenezuelae]WUA94364.1 IclR family transcriptional regulator [Streptomyces pseudovenezuelae]
MLDRAAGILDCFIPSGEAFRLSELSVRSGLPKPTVHRLAADLVRLGWLERSGPHYRLGAKLFELGSLVPHRLDLREAALPFLQDLFEATRETVHLGVREGLEIVYLERIHGHEALRLPSRIGGSLPLSCTGVGKALLAFSGPELTEELLSQPLPSLTPHSITDPARLRTALEKTQVSGLAYEEQEAALGVSCIAAPVFDGGTAVAALSVAVPRDRFSPAQLAPAVRTAALGLSRVLRGGG